MIERSYVPLPARRQEIPKDGGKVRILSIPAIRDRVVQGALKLILEPIFEADFQPGSFGYRPNRIADEAVARMAEAIVYPCNKPTSISVAGPAPKSATSFTRHTSVCTAPPPQ